MPIGHFQQDHIIRFCYLAGQRWSLLEIAVLKDVASRCEDASFFLSSSLTDSFKVQELKRRVRESFYFWNKAVFCIESAQSAIISSFPHNMAAIHTLSQIPEPADTDSTLFFGLLHLNQALKRSSLYVIQPGDPFCQIIQFRETIVLTPLEMEDYLDAAERLGYLPMFMLALTAGLRQGELIALKWSDLDMKKRTLTIAEKRAVERRELVEYGSQTRSIRLTPEVVDLLIMEHSKHPSSPLMFMHPATLKPYSPQMVRRMHNEIIKEAGIDHIRYVDLRHTCAILALKNGTEAKELAQMLGHYRPTITRQNYEPYLPHKVQKDEDMPNEATQSELQQAANILDNLLKF